MPSTISSCPPKDYPADAQRAYEVWISEIMLQQTQVKTVLAYYNQWMRNWPTIFDLAETSLSAVNETWTGLGYYSRAKRIHEAARIVVDVYGGVLPRTAVDLAEEVPGVGRYTAGAIASIAYGERAELVDGNVVRVLSRLRSIGADPKSKAAVALHWSLAKALLDPTRPGDFNQALMEHGATVCTPQTPSCSTCPIQSSCRAFAEQTAAAILTKQKPSGKPNATAGAAIPDIETLCIPCGELPATLTDHTVTRYPQKVTKKPPRHQDTAVCILERTVTATAPPSSSHISEYLLIQRPSSGLLGGLWEFPSVILTPETSDDVGAETDTSYANRRVVSRRYVEGVLGVRGLEERVVSSRDLGSVKHLFSHIEQIYWAEHVVVGTGGEAPLDGSISSLPVDSQKVSVSRTVIDSATTAKGNKSKTKVCVIAKQMIESALIYKWVAADALAAEAVPTGLKKVFALKEKGALTSSLKRAGSGRASSGKKVKVKKG